jgi:hypothetical protein
VVAARPNRVLVVYGLYVAGGATGRVHTEDLALKCWELFPDSFSWTKYPQYPDKDIVRVSLMDARKDRYGAMVSGRVEGHTAPGVHGDPEGWQLTELGLAWVRENLQLFGDDDRPERKAHRQLVLRRVGEFKRSPLFQQFRESPAAFAPSVGQLAAFLKCRVDASPTVWDRRLSELSRLATDAADVEFSQFVGSCGEAYRREAEQ